jgi:hypothetical protein
LRAAGIGRAAKNEGMPWVDKRHTWPESVSVHPDPVSRAQLLELAAKFQHVVDVAPGEILEDLVAEETTASLADLHEPRPDGGARHQDSIACVYVHVGAFTISSPGSDSFTSSAVAFQRVRQR